MTAVAQVETQPENRPAETGSMPLCQVSDLVPYSGVCALQGDKQIALFYLPESNPSIFAIGNWDPIGKANVLSRGILGNLNGKTVVASPLYKQHFDLTTGQCLEDEGVQIPCYKVRIEGKQVFIDVSNEESSE